MGPVLAKAGPDSGGPTGTCAFKKLRQPGRDLRPQLMSRLPFSSRFRRVRWGSGLVGTVGCGDPTISYILAMAAIRIIPRFILRGLLCIGHINVRVTVY
ncbi:hypothetical protein AVEN_254737-1 [Araneus ventricosus]|uniref:Uncharacterized protein n=1 Tax=Araneus ventricosus TaxID=182803 RepID=A0A4Y2SFC3_ARAVE|nr:hypothetical protein AVEN_254737-1 [Araneus ventricosus]